MLAVLDGPRVQRAYYILDGGGVCKPGTRLSMRAANPLESIAV